MNRYCDGIRRRDFLRVGAIGAAGVSLPAYLRMAAAGETAGAIAGAKGKSAIFVFLAGGPPHLDTFDPKPDAPDDIRGEFKPIETNAPGVRICEHLPKLAKCADKFALLRGVSHTVAAHELGTNYLNTGNRPIPSLVFPGFGAVVSKELAGAPDLPHFVAVPSTPQKAGYLGIRYAPLQTGSVPVAGMPFSVRGLAPAEGVSPEQFRNRNRLLNDLDTGLADPAFESKLVDGLDRFSKQAYEMLSSPKAVAAFDTSREKADAAAPFGTGRFGQSCLLAARLVEAGVKFVTIGYGGWDTHSGNFRACRENLLPSLDQGLASLINALHARGLLDSTTVCVTGEFGRTPKINEKAGRDHWPRAMSVLMAGGGVKGGQVIGASDDKGMGPASTAITPDQVAASFYHSLGIDHRKEYRTNSGRPVMIVRDGLVIPGLFG